MESIQPQKTEKVIVTSREPVNFYWKYLPMFSAILITVSSILSTILVYSIFHSLSEFYVLYLIIIGAPIPLLILPSLYFIALNWIKRRILMIFMIIFVLTCALLLSIPFFLEEMRLLIYTGIPVFIGVVVVALNWKNFKLASLTLRVAIKNLTFARAKILPYFTLSAFIETFLASLSVISMFNFAMIEFNASYDELENFPMGDNGIIAMRVLWGVLAFFTLYNQVLLETIAGLFGAAYYNEYSLSLYSKNMEESRNDIKSACLNARHIAFTSSYGTACLGAFLITIFRFLTDNNNNNNNNNSLNNAVTGVASRIIEFLNVQVYVYSAIYGTPFKKSGKMAVESFNNSGVRKFLNFQLGELLLNVMAFCISGLFGGGIGILVASMSTHHDGVIFGIVIGGIIGFSTWSQAGIINSLVGGNSAAQIAIFVEDPERFKQTYPKSEKIAKYLGI